MAEQTDPKQRNASFLRQLEQQRLSKPCTKIIDLRGKVAGECQAYEFGGLTHYLDDRAYLLAKKLLERFKGRYIVAVNEALLKGIKLLPSDVDHTEKKQEAKPILTRDKDNVQAIAFGELLKRTEPRIAYSTSVDLHIDDVLYHANTADITTSAIKIVMRRAFTLTKGDKVKVTFTEFSEKASASFMANVEYTILRIEHDERRTYAVLHRNRDDKVNISEWLDNWTQQHNTVEHLDLDDLLLNIARHYYLRLYTSTMQSPLFWLADNQAKDRIQVINLSDAQLQLRALINNNHTADFSLLPFDQLRINKPLLVVSYLNNGQRQSHIVDANDLALTNQAIKLFSKSSNPAALLLQIKPCSTDLSLIESELAQLKQQYSDSVEAFIERINAIDSFVTVTDISASFKNLIPTAKNANELGSNDYQPWQGNVPEPMLLSPNYQVPHPHYFIKTPVIMSLQGETYDISTRELSVTNVSISIDRVIDINPETMVKLNFTRWQSQTKSVKLSAVPYSIVHLEHWQGKTLIELERNTAACTQSINQFFESAIERNKDELAENDLCYFIAPQSHVLNDAISKSMSVIPLYFGMDANSKRILQAVAAGVTGKHYPLSLWNGLQRLVTTWSEHLKQAKTSVEFGLYCHTDSDDNWQFLTDLDIEFASQKTRFITLAKNSSQYYFFHCTITPLAADVVEQQEDLYQQLLKVRAHRSHKVKQIREVLNSLFAVGTLNDISDIVSATID